LVKAENAPPPPPVTDPPLIEPSASEISFQEPGEASVVAVPPGPVEVAEFAPVQPVVAVEHEPAGSVTPPPPVFDEFDHVGSEISFMLRQAKESADKIRRDAAVEAEAILFQVTSDIEADRAAHDEAAAALIARTEQHAEEVRIASDEYAADTRHAADEYANSLRSEADQLRSEADETLVAARQQAEEITSTARAQARSITDEMVAEAREKLLVLEDTEERSRANLEHLNLTISEALGQMRLNEIQPNIDH